MKFLKAIGSFFKKLLKRIVDFIKKYWVVVLAILAVWFAPQISVALVQAGAPSWMISAAGYVAGNITPVLMNAASWFGSAGSTLWSGYKSLEFGQQAAVALGAMAVIDPEGTVEVIDAAVSDLNDIAGLAAGAVAKGFFQNPLGLAVAALGVWYFFLRDDGDGDGPSRSDTARLTS